MTKRIPPVPLGAETALRALGARLRERRKQLKVSATVTAEAAALSRMTLYRIERGDPSVTMGSYLSVASTLGLEFQLRDQQEVKSCLGPVELPAKIRLADYPELKRLAWQIKKSTLLSPAEAMSIYERNWRHIDLSALTDSERGLIRSLAALFGKEGLLV
jgi:transcriptional regulator with XRE-family HTH domain